MVVGSLVIGTVLISLIELGRRWVYVGGVEFILLIKNFCVVELFVAVLRKDYLEIVLPIHIKLNIQNQFQIYMILTFILCVVFNAKEHSTTDYQNGYQYNADDDRFVAFRT